MLQKAATIKRFEYSPLGIQLKIQTDIVKKKEQYERLDKVYKVDETLIKNDKKLTLGKYNKSNLIHNPNHGFYKYRVIKKFGNLFLEPNYSFLVNLFNDLDKFSQLKTQKRGNKKEKKINVYNTASELYHDLLGTNFDEYYDSSDTKRSKIGPE